MRYILEGIDSPKVIRENAIRIKRGTISIVPLDEGGDCKDAPASDDKTAEVTDTKEAAAPVGKANSKKDKKKARR